MVGFLLIIIFQCVFFDFTIFFLRKGRSLNVQQNIRVFPIEKNAENPDFFSTIYRKEGHFYEKKPVFYGLIFQGMVIGEKTFITMIYGMVMKIHEIFFCGKSAPGVRPGSKCLLMKILMKAFSKQKLDGNTDGW